MTTGRPAGVPILMYHEIAGAPEARSRLAVSPDAWAAQLAYLYSQGYRTVTAAELSVALAGRRDLPDRSVVLTFDDGYQDFYSWGMPLLDRYGFTATLFVTTGWVQDAGPLPRGRRPGRMLSWSQIAEAADCGVEVAAHSHLHPQLDQLPLRRLREELYVSKAQLEDKLGSRVAGLAYPYGYSNSRVRRVARDLEHDYACAVGNAMMSAEPDLLALPRLTIRRSTRIPQFQQIVQGRNVQRLFFKDRVLTRGWAVARRTRAALGNVSRGE
jgi:peptidoglycan/xylan/chitin deacetylase (PgdA/CDA1 family)